MDNRHARLLAAMVAYDKGDAMRIQHFIKVHDFAAAIGQLEGLDKATLDILEAAAIVHDIGIHVSERKYGSCAGAYQEKEGPAEAIALMHSVGGFTEAETERVAWLVGHHHTYKDIKDIDHQILVEADFLVNLYEEQATEQAISKVREKIFRSPSAIDMLDHMLLAQPWHIA